jgi:DNA-binding LytR/AlgR family response regulator
LKGLLIDRANPAHAGLRRLLDGAGRGGVAEGADGIGELLARGAPGDLLLVQAESPAAARSQLCVRVRDGLVRVPVGEVRYFQAEHKYVWVRTARSRLLIPDSLRALAQEFAGRFVRIHRNALVAGCHVTGLSGQGRVSLAGVDETLPVSRRRLAALRRLIREGRESCVISPVGDSADEAGGR